MTPFLLPIAAVPALLGSLWIMEIGAAPRALILQQAFVAVLGFAAALAAIGFSRRRHHAAPNMPVLAALALILFVPLLVEASAEAARWLSVPGFRLYLAPLVLPPFLILWSRTLALGSLAPKASTLFAVLAASALFAQPDAAQSTAFAAAAVPLLWRTEFLARLRLPAVAVFAALAAAAWTVKDPMSPVPYVEGVFLLAAETSALLFALAAVAAALPAAALAWSARSARSSGLLAVALYYGALLLLAPAQVTPVPLLGFGAAPVLGYFIMASLASREGTDAAPPLALYPTS